jgi:hypothetical protein
MFVLVIWIRIILETWKKKDECFTAVFISYFRRN